jgi:lipid-binding SYLF domain-containing protein
MRVLTAVMLLSSSLFAKEGDVDRRLEDSTTVLSEILAAPDKGIPRDLLAKAHCIVIVPGLKKGAFVVGAKYGKGFISCRPKGDSGWSAPAAIRVEGGSFGFQIGGAEIDVVMLVMNDKGANKLLSSQFTLGGEGEVAAGPVGRATSAETDATMRAEILSWSRSRGVFAGIALQGATLRQDVDDNEALYGRRMENREVVTQHVAPPPAAHEFMSLLTQYSPKEK